MLLHQKYLLIDTECTGKKALAMVLLISAQMKQLYQQMHFLAHKILSTVEMLPEKKCCKKTQTQKSHS